MINKGKPLEILVASRVADASDLDNYLFIKGAREAKDIWKRFWEGIDNFNVDRTNTGYRCEGVKRYAYYCEDPNFLSKYMKVVEHEIQGDVNITAKHEYTPDLGSLAQEFDIVVSEISLFGNRLTASKLLSDKELCASDQKIRDEVVAGFESLYGEKWFKLDEEDMVPFGNLREENWKYWLIRDIEHPLREPDSARSSDFLGGLHLFQEIENTGKKVTLYCTNSPHQRYEHGIYIGLLEGTISPGEFIEIFDKCRDKHPDKNELIVKPGIFEINNGRIIFGKTSEDAPPNVKDWADIITKAINYQQQD